jgi:hypothetical protein
MERSGGRRRGESFHEEFEKPKPTSNTGQNNSHVLTSSSHTDHNPSNSPNRTNRRPERAVEFMTSEFNPHHSDGPEPLDLSQLEDDLEDESADKEGNSDDNDEDEIFSRGRSRSHSMHQNDSLPLPLPGESHPPSIYPPNMESHLGSNQGESKAFEKVERTGPLHQREVQALRKVRVSYQPLTIF